MANQYINNTHDFEIHWNKYKYLSGENHIIYHNVSMTFENKESYIIIFVI